MNKTHFIEMAEQTTKEEFQRGWVYLGKNPYSHGVGKKHLFCGFDVSNRDKILEISTSKADDYLAGTHETNHYFMVKELWESYMDEKLPTQFRIWEKQAQLEKISAEIDQLEKEKIQNAFNQRIKQYEIDLPVQVEISEFNYIPVRWELINNKDGSQTVIPTLDK